MATNYLWDPISDNVIKEYDDGGNTVAAYTHEPGLYGKLLSQERAGEVRHFHYDGAGSTSALTDNLGNVTDTYVYNAFGEAIARSGSSVNPFGFRGALGYYANASTDSISVRRRTLVARIARWLSPDPIGEIDSTNLYLYALNNPTNYSDPSGLSCRRDDSCQVLANPSEQRFSGPVVGDPPCSCGYKPGSLRVTYVKHRDKKGYGPIGLDGWGRSMKMVFEVEDGCDVKDCVMIQWVNGFCAYTRQISRPPKPVEFAWDIKSFVRFGAELAQTTSGYWSVDSEDANPEWGTVTTGVGRRYVATDEPHVLGRLPVMCNLLFKTCVYNRCDGFNEEIKHVPTTPVFDARIKDLPPAQIMLVGRRAITCVDWRVKFYVDKDENVHPDRLPPGVVSIRGFPERP